MPIFPNLERPTDSVLVRSSPGYEINETDDKYQIAVDVPGVNAKDMSVQLENDGKLLHISGGRKVVTDNTTTETKFEKRFTIGSNVDMQKVTANLADGVLVLSAPKIENKEKPLLNIKITEGPLEEKKDA
jgi:HSP20 family protein